MNLFKKSSVIVAVLLSIAATSVQADDVVPAPWRGEGLYTFQEWEFHTPGPITPDGEIPEINPNGSAVATPGPGLMWDPSFMATGLDGYVGTSGGSLFSMFPILSTWSW